ncbi:MAG: hypothetical protein KDI34_20770, partial [Halioglobus sp.]|nr:hypothetical protein [Halioglobus sp.]
QFVMPGFAVYHLGIHAAKAALTATEPEPDPDDETEMLDTDETDSSLETPADKRSDDDRYEDE